MFKLISWVGAPILRWFPAAAKSATTVGKTSSFRKGIKYLWTSIDMALTGYMVYDYFTDDKDEEFVIRERALSFVTENILAPEIRFVLAANINDLSAVSLALTNASLSLNSELLDGYALRGLAYMALADYIERNPVGTRYSPEVIADISKKETLSFLTTGSTEGMLMFKELDDSLAACSIAQFPDMSLRNLDFMIFFAESFQDIAEDEKAAILQSAKLTAESTVIVGKPTAVMN